MTTYRFKQFLREHQMDLHDVADQINLNCRPFLSEIGRLSMYRGMDVSGERKTLPSFSRHPPERKPRDSSLWFNFMFNTIIHLAYGVEDVRYKSYFAVGDIGAAAAYGDVFRIYPKGEFQFIWSDRIEDSVLGEDVLLNTILVNLWMKNEKSITNSNIKTLLKVLCRFTSTSKDLVDGTLDDEIINYARDYLPTTNAETFPQIFRECLEEAGLKLYKNSDISAALKSNNEIIIYESGGYYTIPLAYADKDEIDMALTL